MTDKLNRRLRLGTLLIALLLASCNFPGLPKFSLLCTMMGCGPELRITLAGDARDEYQLNVRWDEQEVLMVCGPEDSVHGEPESNGPQVMPNCAGGQLWIWGETPEQLTVTLQQDGSQSQWQFNPQYKVFYPNGRGCPPECRSAEVSIDLDQVP